MTAGVYQGGAEAVETASPSRLRRSIASAARAQEGRAFLWSPVALAVGIGLYFSLMQEPPVAVAAAAGLAGLATVWFGRAAPLIVLAGLVACGFALAKLRTETVAAPMLHATTGEVALTGRVLAVDRTSKGRIAITLEPDAIEGVAPDRMPRALRLSALAKSGLPPTGARIAAKARLQPVPSPVMPGGFDYGRQLFFQGVGGMGRITSPVQTLDAHVPFTDYLAAAIADTRAVMGERIKAVLEEPYASFAEALITGERSSIPKAINQSLIVSGLFHILSISGLHMWLVAGGVFWTVRAGLALIPALALRFPIKKWAAAAALAMGLFYMLLAEGGVATERSFLMIAIVFFAVLVDRPAVSTRNLAIAALGVLLLTPEAAVEASFQMSFLAVAGLVAFYEWWGAVKAARGAAAPERGPVLRVLWWMGSATVASLVTTVIAGSMSSIPAAWHFGRLSPYGIIANGLAIPVTGLIVMPAALIAAVLMPFHLEALPLTVMGQGLKLVIFISDSVAALPGAAMITPQPPALPMLLLATGAVTLCLLRGWIRLTGALLMIAGLACSVMLPRPLPDILVERAGAIVAVRNADGLLVPALPKRARFTVEKWLSTDGDEAAAGEAAKRTAWTCTANRCDAMVKGKRVAYVHDAEGKPIACDGLAVLVSDAPLRGACRGVPLRIDRFDLWKNGAYAVTFGADETTVTTARAGQGARPWVAVPERRAKPGAVPRPQAFGPH